MKKIKVFEFSVRFKDVGQRSFKRLVRFHIVANDSILNASLEDQRAFCYGKLTQSGKPMDRISKFESFLNIQTLVEVDGILYEESNRGIIGG